MITKPAPMLVLLLVCLLWTPAFSQDQGKSCIGDHIAATDNPDEKADSLVRCPIIFTAKADQFELKKKYLFTVRVRGQVQKGGAIDKVDLLGFDEVDDPGLDAGRVLKQSVKQPRDVVEAYLVCQAFERLMAKNLDFGEAYEATFVASKARRRAIAIADGEFGDLDLAGIDDESLIKAYKLRMQIFYLTLPLAGPSDAEEPIFFPPEINAILKRKAPTNTREFAAYVSQLERDVTRFRAHLDRLAANDPTVAERINKFKTEALAAKITPPTDHRVQSSLGYIAAGVLSENEAHYEINSYLVAKEQGQMRIVGIRFFNRLF